jgi:hypothetical protein
MAFIDDSPPDITSPLSLDNAQLSSFYFDLLAFISALPPPSAAVSMETLTSIPLPSAAASSTAPPSTAASSSSSTAINLFAGAIQGGIAARSSSSVAAQISASSVASVAGAEVSSAESAAVAEGSKFGSEISAATQPTTTEAHPESENPVIQAPYPTATSSVISIPTSLFK